MRGEGGSVFPAHRGVAGAEEIGRGDLNFRAAADEIANSSAVRKPEVQAVRFVSEEEFWDATSQSKCRVV